MSDDVDLQQEILQRTLQEVARAQDEDAADPCVICLEPISEPAEAVPCKHANFDFLCLVSWLEQRRNCPLCKSDVSSVKHDFDGPGGPKIYQLPPVPSSSADSTSSRPSQAPFHQAPRRLRPLRSLPPPPPQSPDDPLVRRQRVYRNQLYSLRVGSNRLSQYRELTPDRFNRDEELVSRARKWIRRELRVFEFLNPDTEISSQSRMGRPGQQRLQNRRGNNAEFLLEYIIAILRTVDIKGSAGQAEELLRDFLGRDNASLFLHELQAWLRSPYTSLDDWDRHVQYDDTASQQSASGSSVRERDSSDRISTPVYRGYGRRSRGRVEKPHFPQRLRSQQFRDRSHDSITRARRVQDARDRYFPD